MVKKSLAPLFSHFTSLVLFDLFLDFFLTFLMRCLHVFQFQSPMLFSCLYSIYVSLYLQVLESSPQQQQPAELDPTSSECAGSSWEDLSEDDFFSDEVITTHYSEFAIWFILRSCYFVSLVSSTWVVYSLLMDWIVVFCRNCQNSILPMMIRWRNL